MVYESCKKNSQLHYFIEAKNKADAHRVSRLLWGVGVDFSVHETSPQVLVMLHDSYIVKILDSGKLIVPSSYKPYNEIEKAVMA